MLSKSHHIPNIHIAEAPSYFSHHAPAEGFSFSPRPGTLANLLARDGGMGIFEEINSKVDNTFDKFIGNCEKIYVLKMKI